LKTTAAFTSWLQDSQGEKYTRDMLEQATTELNNLCAVAAVSTDPTVRGQHARWHAYATLANFLKNSRKESVQGEDE
jgi:hypothetical protein